MGGAARRERTLEGRPLHLCLHLARRLARRLDQTDPPAVEPPPDVERCERAQNRESISDIWGKRGATYGENGSLVPVMMRRAAPMPRMPKSEMTCTTHAGVWCIGKEWECDMEGSMGVE